MSTRDGKLVALLGVKDLVVVDTPDALLIADRHRAQEVGALVKAPREAQPGRSVVAGTAARCRRRAAVPAAAAPAVRPCSFCRSP